MLKSKYKIYLLLLCLTGCVSEYNANYLLPMKNCW